MAERRQLLLPFIALVAGLIGTLVAAVQTSRAEQGRTEVRFHAIVDGVEADLQSRMLAQLTLLRGTAGYFNASDLVTREDFRAFVDRLRLERNYPGVLGIGFAAYARDRASLARLIATARADDAPGIQAWPDDVRPGGYSAILLLEPMDRRNQTALGYDMLSEKTRRAAMEMAARRGVAAMSGRVRLVQEIDPVKQPGFLIYLPLYQQEGGGGANGRGRLRGWVYSPLRAHDLFETVFTGEDVSPMVVEVFDGAVAQDRLLYRSGQVEADPAFVELRPVEIAGRPWLIRVSSTGAFEDGSPVRAAALVAGAGLTITLLIVLLMMQQARSAARTEREVRLRTAELVETNARLLEEGRAREEAEGQVRQMQKMDAIGQLTGGIAHDFNNMLAIVIGNLDMAQRRFDQPEKLGRAVAGAMEGARKAADLTQRLLAFGRRQALAPRAVDANALVKNMSELLVRTLGETVRLELRLEEALAKVHADPVQLENAILNLALNGRDAMPEGGLLIISTSRRTTSPPGTGAEESDDQVLISVRDTGGGMSEEVSARALEPFFTTKEVGRGTGLGLSQVYGFVQQSGGHLSLRSAPGEGTCVEISLPTHRGGEEDPADEDQEKGVPIAPAQRHILVVEDEAHVRAVAVESLRELGYEVVEASNGVEALQLLDDNPQIELLFTDVVMPGMNGRELAEAAKQVRPELKVVFTTGYAPEEIFDPAALDGAPPLLRKPFTLTQLARQISATLDKAAPA